MDFKDLKTTCRAIIAKDVGTTEKLNAICTLLRDQLDRYDWVGFYFADREKRTLHLKAFAGQPTDHTVIPFGKGICGQVAESDQNFLVPDVSAQDNYIACSANVRSELVVPLFKDGENIGQIDIDSHTPNAFTAADEQLLEWVNGEVATIL